MGDDFHLHAYMDTCFRRDEYVEIYALIIMFESTSNSCLGLFHIEDLLSQRRACICIA
jgi:hypothetical protein